MQNLKLSLVTSCYNAEHYLDELSESILHQDYQEWEWILADDFSDDNTKQKILEISKLDSRIIIVKPEYKKQVWWNPQIFANGDIVCHIDADDKILPKTLNLVNYYFNKFPDVVLMHFNANKYKEILPNNKQEFLDNFLNNVYISNDNNSFLEGFSKLWPNRSNIFGYLRIFRNLPGLMFPVHQDGDICSSNDGQWLLFMEERGKWLSVPRTTYLARDHFYSESHRQWNIRGEAKLVTDALERRKDFILEYPRNVKYFDDIYDLAESVYTSKLNFEENRCKISFINYDYDIIKQEKAKMLFHDHDIEFDQLNGSDYFFIKINLDSTVDDIKHFLNNISHDTSQEIVLFSDNAHLHKNNRNNTDNLEIILTSIHNENYIKYWYVQDNRLFCLLKKTIDIHQEIEEEQELIAQEPFETDELNPLKILHILPEKNTIRKKYIFNNILKFSENFGHTVDVKKYQDVTQNDIEKYDIIHNHDYTLISDLDTRFIPHITSHYLDDTNNNFQLNNSLVEITLDKELYGINRKLNYVEHGIDKNIFFNAFKRSDEKRLLCVEKITENSKIHLSLLVASSLKIPIDIITFDFDQNTEYGKVLLDTIDEVSKEVDVNHYKDLTDNEYFDVFNRNHYLLYFGDNYSYPFIMNAYGTGMIILSTIDLSIDHEKIEPNVKNIINVIDNLTEVCDSYSKKNSIESNDFRWENSINELTKIYYSVLPLKEKIPFSMKNRLTDLYNTDFEIDRSKKMMVDDVIFDVTIRPNPYVKIEGSTTKSYNVNFIDTTDESLVYRSDPLTTGCWSAASKSYYIPWRVKIEESESGNIVYDETLNLKDKRVFVWFDSSAMGDNIAWIQPVEEFRKKHQCHVICSTFFNDYFSEVYPDIEFVEPNIGYDDFEHQYRIGFFDQGDLSPFDRKDVPLQKLCAGILGLTDFEEIPSKIKVKEEETEIQKPYVAIATQSTAQAKYWNFPSGWEIVVDYLKNKGYNVVCVDKHQFFGQDKYLNKVPENAIQRQERTLDQTIATINGAEFFIGLGSGLSWLAWALNKHVVLISGFSHPKSEFHTKCIRVFSDKQCNSCYNRHKFDPGDWLWCPDHKGTDRMFECTKNITPEEVFQAIDNVIDMRNNDFK